MIGIRRRATPGSAARSLGPAQRWRGRGERGQVLVLAVLSSVVLAGGAALALDVVRLLEERRAAQAAVDHAAATAAVAACGGATTEAARTAGRAAAQRNGYDDASPTIAVGVDPVPGESGTYRAVISSTVPGSFTRLLGMMEFPVTVEATYVAEGCGTRVANPGTIYGGGTCEPGKGVDLSGSNMTIGGSIHANADLKIGGSVNDYDEVTYVDVAEVSGSGITFAPGTPAYPRDVGPSLPNPQWPSGWAPADASATLFAAYKALAAANGTDYGAGLPPSTIDRNGVWFTSTTNEWTISGVTGLRSVVLVSQRGEISFSNGYGKIRAWSGRGLPRPGIVALSGKVHSSEADKCSKHTIKLSGSNWEWAGVMWSPGGLVEFSGSDNATGAGSLVGWGIKLSGQNIRIAQDTTLLEPLPPQLYLKR